MNKNKDEIKENIEKKEFSIEQQLVTFIENGLKKTGCKHGQIKINEKFMQAYNMWKNKLFIFPYDAKLGVSVENFDFNSTPKKVKFTSEKLSPHIGMIEIGNLIFTLQGYCGSEIRFFIKDKNRKEVKPEDFMAMYTTGG